MKIALLLSTVVVVGVSCYDQFYMDLITAQMLADKEDIPALADKLGLTDLLKYAKAAGLAEALSGPGPFTVFGPTNDAFAAIPDAFKKILASNVTLLRDVLSYHVIKGNVLSKDLTNEELVPTLEGKKIRINVYGEGDSKVITASGRKVAKPDQMASNGVIHVVNNVLYPPPGTLVDVAVGCPYFSTLANLVVKAGLGKTLSGDGPFTLFAPTNPAFDKVDPKIIKYLTSNKTALIEVLEYHVVSGTFYSAGLKPEQVPTVEGEDVTISFDGGKVEVNKKATVTYADLTVTNGVIHSIDEVLIPPSLQKRFNPVQHSKQFLFKPFRL